MIKQLKTSDRVSVSRAISIFISVVLNKGGNRSKQIVDHKWHWHKAIPFVVAKVQNKEFESLRKIADQVPTLMKMYNEDGSWFILESPSYWFFGVNFKNEFCFYDSLHIEHTFMSEESRHQSMIDRAESDIDELYKIPKKYASQLIRRIKFRRDQSEKK